MILGIDLGTTKSAASIFIGGKPFIIPDATGNQSIPSLVLVTPNKKYSREEQRKTILTVTKARILPLAP